MPHVTRFRGSGVPGFRRWLRGWLDVRLLLIGLVMLGCELGEGSANSWLTPAVKEDHGQTAAVAALFFTAFAAAGSLRPVPGHPVPGQERT